jgi:hypothetical protein
MRVQLNLARAQGFRQRHLVGWSVPVLGLGALLLLRMLAGVQANWRQFQAVRASADKETGRQNDLLTREAALRRKLDEPANRALLREAQFINHAIDERRLSFGELTDKVTNLLPPQARLAALSMPDTSGEPLVHFAIEGASEEPVETFLANLENSPDFKDLIITNQGFEEKQSGGAPVSITCSARYVGGRSDAASLGKSRTAPARAGDPGESKTGNLKTGAGPMPATGGGAPSGKATSAARPQGGSTAVPVNGRTPPAPGTGSAQSRTN